MRFRYLYIILFFFSSSNLIGQENVIHIPQTKDSLESFILNRRSIGKTDWSYYLALKGLSRKLMYENRKLALNYLNEAMTIAEMFKDTVEIAAINHLMGLTFRHWGYTYAAAEYFQQSYILSEKIGRKNIAGFDLLSIGNIYYDLKKWQEAELYYRKALISFNKDEEVFGSSVCMNNLALIFQETGHTDSAMIYFQKGLNLRKKQSDSLLIGHSYWYISTVLYDMKNIEDGLKYTELASNYFNKYYNPEKYFDLRHVPLAISYYRGNLYALKNQLDSSLHYWNKAVEIGKFTPEMTSYYFAAYREIARLKSTQGNNEEALSLLKEAINQASKTHFNEEMEKLYLQTADLLEKMGYFSEAATYLREYQVLLKNKALGASNQMLNFHVLFETYEQQTELREKEMQLEKERLKRKQQNQLNLMYLFGLGISILGLLIVLYLYRSIIKINHTLELKNKAIEEKNKIIESNANELEDLNKTKDLLFSVIAHDLRSPFNALTSFSKLMQSYINNNQWQELKNSFRILEESSQKAYWTFENLLGWVQGQTGKLEADLKPVDIMPLLDEAIGLSSSMLLLKNLHIEKKVAQRYVLADPYMLETVLRNLITNAIKFSKEEDNILIETSYENDMMKIVISDEGLGMSPEMIKNLFNPEKLKVSGQSISGLGLLICKQFVDSMNGQITVNGDNHKKGTDFIIYLPFADRTDITSNFSSETISNFDSKELSLSPESKKVLQPFIDDLLSLSVYEASEVKEVIQKIKFISNSEDIENWLDKMHQALYLSDSISFDKLIEEISSNA